MLCSQCGIENHAEAHFCVKCGHSMSCTSTHQTINCQPVADGNTINGSETLFRDDIRELIVTNTHIQIKSLRIALRKVSAVFVTMQRKPKWPGVVLLIWGIGVFYNDTLPEVYGVKPNNPLFKWVLMGMGLLWLFYRQNSSVSHNVFIKFDGEEMCIAADYISYQEAEALSVIITNNIG